MGEWGDGEEDVGVGESWLSLFHGRELCLGLSRCAGDDVGKPCAFGIWLGTVRDEATCDLEAPAVFGDSLSVRDFLFTLWPTIAGQC